jgi:hypothetical protein
MEAFRCDTFGQAFADPRGFAAHRRATDWQ